MRVTPKELLEIKVKLLKDMDEYIRFHVDDEEEFDCWLMCGVPDMADHQDYEDIAEDEDLWLDVIKTFAKLTIRK